MTQRRMLPSKDADTNASAPQWRPRYGAKRGTSFHGARATEPICDHLRLACGNYMCHDAHLFY